jgi:hypothetical protein
MLVFVVVGAAAGGSLARASVVGHKPRRLAPAGQVVLGSPFQPMKAVNGVWASGDYVLLSTSLSPGFASTGWIVINNRLGTTAPLDPQCRVDGLGPPWVLMSCLPVSNPDDVELYSLVDGTRQTITPSPGVPICPNGSPSIESECAGAGGVGAYWISWGAGCYHCTGTSFFQNIQTGELRDDPTNATTFADLNSPGLAHRTCLESALTSNDGAIVWQGEPGQLIGLFLPGLQTFTIPLPSAITKPPGAPDDTPVLQLEIAADALYVKDGWDGTILADRHPDCVAAEHESTKRHAFRRHPDLQTREPAQRGPFLLRLAGRSHRAQGRRPHPGRG